MTSLPEHTAPPGDLRPRIGAQIHIPEALRSLTLRPHLPRMVFHVCWLGTKTAGVSARAWRPVWRRGPAGAGGGSAGKRDVTAVYHRWWTWARMRWS